MSVPGGPISGSEALQRAQYWISNPPPGGYDPNGSWSSPEGTKYRTDCSGFVSMSLHLLASPNTTEMIGLFPSTSKASLGPGDLLIALPGAGYDAGHVVMFESWVDSSQDAYNCYEFGYGAAPLHHQQTYPYNPSDGRNFRPHHYPLLTGGNMSAASMSDAQKLAKLGPKLIGTNFPTATDHKVTKATVQTDSSGVTYLDVEDDQGGFFSCYADGHIVYEGRVINHVIDPGPNGVHTLTGIPKWFNFIFPGAGNIDDVIDAADTVTGTDALGNTQNNITNTVVGLPQQIATAVTSGLKSLISLPFMLRIGEGLLAVLILVIAIALYVKSKVNIPL